MVNLFVSIARNAGIEAIFVEVEDFENFYRIQDSIVRSTHIVGGVELENQLVTVDFLPSQPKRYRILQPISDQRAAAHYYNATAYEAMLAGNDARAETLFRAALEVDPQFAEGWSNYAVLVRRQGDLEKAISYLKHSLALDPRLLPAMENLAAFYRIAQKPDLASAMEAQVLDLKTKNPFFLLQQGIRQIQQNDLNEASRLLERAKRLDSEIPEIYVALGRIELKRGNERRANQYFAKAQKQSDAYSAGFQRVLQTKIDKLLEQAGAAPPES